MTRANRFMQELANEVILYGGLPMRRLDVLTLAGETWGRDYKGKLFGPDYFAFRPKAVDLEPLSLDDARRIVGND